MEYGGGACLGVVIGLSLLLYRILRTTSVFAGNLRTLGLRQSLITGQVQNHGGALTEAALSLLLIGVLALLSWVGVIVEVVGLCWNLINRYSAPIGVREGMWRLENVPMSRADILRQCRAILEVRLGRPLTEAELGSVDGSRGNVDVEVGPNHTPRSQTDSPLRPRLNAGERERATDARSGDNDPSRNKTQLLTTDEVLNQRGEARPSTAKAHAPKSGTPKSVEGKSESFAGRVVGAVVMVMTASAVRYGCAELRRAEVRTEVANVKTKLDDGSLLRGVVASYRAAPRQAWRSARDRSLALRTFQATSEPTLREFLTNPRVLQVREADDDNTSVAELEFTGTYAEKLPVHGWSRNFITDQGVTVLLAFSDEKSFAAAKSQYAKGVATVERQIRANSGRAARQYVELPGWEKLDDDESKAANIAIFGSFAKSTLSVIVVHHLSPTEMAAQIDAHYSRPENRTALNAAVMGEVNRATVR